MTSDPSLLLQRVRRLSQLLLISGALNIGVLSLLLYWALREKPPTPYCELKPTQQQIYLSDQRKCTEVLAELSQLSFPQLVNRLSNTQMVEDGYAERDFALAILSAFHHFDVYRALPKHAQPQQKRYFSWKPNPNDPSIPLIIYPDLQQHHYDALIQFAKTERWPLTSEGLFLILKEQMNKNALNDNLIETFYLTPHYWTVELLFNRSGQPLEKREILQLILEGEWPVLKNFVEQQKQLQDTSDSRRQKLLADYLKEGSSTSATLLLKNDWEFAVKKLDDQQALALLQAMPIQLPESEQFAKEMLASPRSASVWKKASQWLYAKSGELFPEPWDYQTALTRFAPDKLPLITKKETPIVQQIVSNIEPPKLQPEIKKLPAVTPKTTKIEKKPEVKKTQKPDPKPRIHVIQEGDSLWKIARRYGVKIEEIRKINGLQSDNLQVGSTLKIPTGKLKS